MNHPYSLVFTGEVRRPKLGDWFFFSSTTGTDITLCDELNTITGSVPIYREVKSEDQGV